MVSLNEELTIASSAQAVWPLLRDPAVVAGCIPGAELSTDSEDDLWRGSIRVKFGPTVALFRGEATLQFDDAARRVTIEGRGIDARGASRALATSVVELRAEHPHVTTMAVDGEFSVTGPLEAFVNAGGVHVARALLIEFCANIAAVVADAETQMESASASSVSEARDAEAVVMAATADQSVTAPSPSAEVLHHRPSAELSATALLWRALWNWIKNLFAKG